MARSDPDKRMKDLYDAKREPTLVDVPAMNFLMIDGMGDPNTSRDYREAVEALYSLSYKLKFAVKKAGGPDYRVSPLEALWWADDPSTFLHGKKDEWRWTVMIMQPEPVTEEMVAHIKEELGKKKDLPALSRIRFERFEEGLSVQVLHIGPYSEEGPTIQKMHAYAADNGYVLRDKHHEIYIGDPRRAAPEKLKTILRQPVTSAQ
ncbi:MAG: GyrI-like domain-containing protein [Methanomassiliicoccaceae archaeon]|jgi:hypothetical protein|nr:hypothetical protein [Euryarchaeota archaeon]HOB38388.1 GyrI-like domain-containing protein [Methanomassiliicoccaceae archaeon]HOQ26649.1 GyrI-like domain-containing protein [Methanomassiliicoccaceae archaeon]HPP45390.1 GyrI-like domain-containing protein [Methanomassiliicoccaceae archaeon]HQA20401.1 GyrI-like domain-containing protein [Methanomassiliicoccaceae archaeon]